MQKISQKNYEWLYCLLLGSGFVLLLTTQLIYAWDYTADDAYISLRYAQHLAQGYHLAWNIGQPPVEGYSNFSVVLLEALLLYFNWPAMVLMKVFSVILLAMTGVCMYHIARLWLSSAIAWLPAILLISYYGTILWSVSGLETSIYQCLIVAAVYCIFRGLGYGSSQHLATRHTAARFFYGFSILMSLASLTRPEAPVLFGVFYLGLIYEHIKYRHQVSPLSTKILIACGLVFLMLYVPYFTWRVAYFGQWFPNPIYCKFMNSTPKTALIINYLYIAMPLMVLSIPFLLQARDIRHYFLWIPSLVYCFILYGSDPLVGYFNRYFIPALSLLVIAAILGIQQFFAFFASKRLSLSELACINLVIIVTLNVVLIVIPHFTPTQYHILTSDYVSRNRLRIRTSQWLQQHMTAKQWLAVGDCGIIPYYVHANIIDTLCLNSLEMTSSNISLSNDKFTAWLLKVKRPEMIVITRNNIRLPNSVVPNFTLPSNAIFLKIDPRKSNVYMISKLDDRLLHDLIFIHDYHLSATFTATSTIYSYQYDIYQRIAIF